MFKSWDWQVLGSIVALLATIFKAIQYVWKQIDKLRKENKKQSDTIEELRILVAKQSAVLRMTSNYLKENMTEGLDDFLKDD